MFFLIFIIGLLVGSFLNVCIYRIPKKETVVTTPSHCPSCGKNIPWFDLIPVISYLLLGSKCRSCKGKISYQYPLVELLNGLLFSLLYLKLGFTLSFYGYCLMFSALIVISAIDLESYEIPGQVLKFLLIFGLIFNIISVDKSIILSGIIGFFAVSVPMLLLSWASKGGFGGGDIKLMAVCGLFLGWKLIIVSFFAGAFLAGLSSLFLLFAGKKKKKDIIPFGPFLAFGMLVSVFWGNEFIHWYFGLFF